MDTSLDASLDTALLPEAGMPCACCVLESMDAAGILLDCGPAPAETDGGLDGGSP